MVEVNLVDEIPVATLSGDIDMANVGAIERSIARGVSNDAYAVILDLSAVTYLDSAGIRLLFQVSSQLAGRRRRSAIVIPEASPIRRTLEAAGVYESLMITATVEQALALATAAD
jgi:anti-anti-sigma factor